MNIKLHKKMGFKEYLERKKVKLVWDTPHFSIFDDLMLGLWYNIVINQKLSKYYKYFTKVIHHKEGYKYNLVLRINITGTFLYTEDLRRNFSLPIDINFSYKFVELNVISGEMISPENSLADFLHLANKILTKKYPYFKGSSLFVFDHIVTDINVKQMKNDPELLAIRERKRALTRKARYLRNQNKKSK